ncbi:uncharacterized protein LOC144825112 [Lissotriton helveticus]
MAESGNMEMAGTQQQQQQEGECSRKRKIKFSETELETLIQEMVPNHDVLFGKSSRKVPETRKRSIWAAIQAKVNAVGVTRRSVDVLRKRWYDLRQRSKEKVAARLEQSRPSGGGTSTVPESTPPEELVEGTRVPESVTDVADLDSSEQQTSRPAPATTQPTGSGRVREHPDSGDAGQEPESDGEDSPVNPLKKQRRHIVRPLPPKEEEAEDSNNNLQSEDTRPQQESRPQDSQGLQGTARRRNCTASSFGDQADESVFAGLELNMLQVQRLQAKNIKALQREVRAGLRGIQGEVRGAMQALRGELRAERRELERMDRYTWAINRLASATNVQTRRSILMQREFSHGMQDIATAVVQATSALDELRALRTAGPGVLTPSEEDAVRSNSTPPPIMERRRSGRSNRPATHN